jgi:hypothetical protein
VFEEWDRQSAPAQLPSQRLDVEPFSFHDASLDSALVERLAIDRVQVERGDSVQ